ncbi:hypothetical protein FG062_07170 [Vibrio cholerae]|nr:hypothetical protein [Vibrio cholerae]EGR0599396.1 hypothetical protein [Vibrio cholerae]
MTIRLPHLMKCSNWPMNVCIPLSVGKTHSIAFDLYQARLCILLILILQFAICNRNRISSFVYECGCNETVRFLPDFHAKVANEKLARNLHLLD